MPVSRRESLRVTGLAAVTAFAGCTSLGGSQEYAPIVVENNHDAVHAISATVISPPEHAGYTKYFSEAINLPAGDSETFDEGLAFSDHDPRLLAMAMTEMEKTATHEFDLRSNFPGLAFLVTADGELDITPSVL